MRQEFSDGQARVMELLRSLPQPGRILLDSVGNGIKGFYLRPKEIPQVISGRIVRSTWASVDLIITNGERNFVDSCPVRLSLRSLEWERWCEKKQPFVIQAKDVGEEIDVIREREKNFNRNLLHAFLDQFSITITIKESDRERILDPDNYSHYFWNNAASVSGSSSMGNVLSIGAVINGISQDSGLVIVDSDLAHLGYERFLTEDKRPLMRIVIKWHKALITLLHLMKRDDVRIPIDFEELRRVCQYEIETQS